MNFTANSTILELYEPDAAISFPHNGTGSIDQIRASDANIIDVTCYKYNAPTSAAPSTSVNPTTSTSPTTTSSPSKAPTYTLFNGTGTGYCADGSNNPFSWTSSPYIGTNNDDDVASCDPFPGDSPALTICSKWCSK